MTMEIGILCLQGDFEAHGRLLEKLGVPWRDVRRPAQLEGLQGLILPGGESTTMWHFLRKEGLDQALQDFGRSGGALYGTCAGAILLARDVLNPAATGLGLLDITVERNAYGRQTESSIQESRMEDAHEPPIETVLIRAPRIVKVGPEVRVRARMGADPVWVEQGRVQATTFHPELSGEPRIHRRFLSLVQDAPSYEPRAHSKRTSSRL
jgi:5'-phosphate synthase pdxT subunit